MDTDNQEESDGGRLRRPLWRGAGLILFFFFATFLGWPYLRPLSGFAKNLPADTSFYVSLALPSRLVDWLPADLSLIADAAAYFKNRLELARLPDGTILVKTRLRDQAAWTLFASRRLEFYWQIFGRDLYISNQSDIAKYLAPSQPSLAGVFKPAWPEPGQWRPSAVTAWLANTDWLAEFPAYQSLLVGLDLPLAVEARDYGGYWQWSFGNPVNAARLKTARRPAPGNDLEFNINDFSKIISSQWWPAARGQFTGLEKARPVFYGLDMASFREKLASYSAEIYLGGPSNQPDFIGKNWLVKLQSRPGQGQTGIMEPVKQAAAAFFSLTHPLSVEHILADGSSLIELRAEREGLEWQIEDDLSVLRGQGEEQGIYLSSQPDQGALLSNSGLFIRDYLQKQGGFSLSDKSQTVCLSPAGSILNAAFKIGRDSVDRAYASLDADANLRLCTFFGD